MRREDFGHKFFRNTVASYIGRLAEIATSIVLFPCIVRYLGLEASGIWILVTTLTSYFDMLDFGLSPSLTKHVAEYVATDARKELSEVTTAALLVYATIGLSSFAILVVGGGIFISVQGISDSLVNDARLVLYIAALAIGLGFPLSTFAASLKGLQRYDLIAAIALIVSALKLTLTFLVLALGFGVVAVVIANAASMAVGWCVALICAWKLLPVSVFRISHLNTEMIRRLFRFGGAVFVVELCMRIMYPTVKLLVGLLRGVEMLAYYEAAFKIYRVVMDFPYMLTSAVLPIASELHALRESVTLRALLLRGTKYLYALFLAMAVPTLFLSGPLLTVWMGEGFGQYWPVVVILILHLFFNFNHLFAYHVLLGINKLRFVLLYYLLSSGLTLGLSPILIRHFGLTGAALSIALPFIVAEPLFMRYVFKSFNIHLGSYIEVLSPVYLVGALISIPLYILTRVLNAGDWFQVVAFWLLGFSGYLVLFLILGFEGTERRELIDASLRLIGGSPTHALGLDWRDGKSR